MHWFTRCRWLPLLLIVLGCNSTNKRRHVEATPTPSAIRGTPAVPKPLAINDRPLSPARQRETIEDRELLIPPPPTLNDMAQKPTPEPKSKVDPALIQASNNEPIIENPARVEKDESLVAMKRLQQTAATNYARMDAFEARLTRREVINNKANPQEVIRFQYRQQPYSVHLTWIGGDKDALGREVIYVHGQFDGKMHIKPTRDDTFPLPASPMSFAPDSSMVRSKSRHDIREAGLGEGVRHLGEMLAWIEKNPSQRGRLKYLGLVQRPEYPNKLEAIEETVPAKTEKMLPLGAKRTYYFDPMAGVPSSGLPVIVNTFDATGKEVEYYCFDRFQFPVRFNDADFNPQMAFGKK